MGREIKRVPFSFDWPLNETWEGYLNPHYNATKCPKCVHGLSEAAEHWHNQWYGTAPFNPAETGSISFTCTTPSVVEFAKRNVTSAPYFYGTDSYAVTREATRLARLFNGCWSHHLDYDDIKALIAADRLWDFTRVARTPKQELLPKHENGWLKKDTGYIPSPQEVNNWSIQGFGHDSTNCYIAIKAKAKRLGVPYLCKNCKGNTTIWKSKADEKRYDEWKPTEPPKGKGWQLWETVSEGSPISPVFRTASEFILYLMRNGYSQLAAKKFVKLKWVPSMIIQDDGNAKKDIECAEIL